MPTLLLGSDYGGMHKSADFEVITLLAFTADEDRPNAGDFVVLSNAFWKRAFGGDPRMIGNPQCVFDP